MKLKQHLRQFAIAFGIWTIVGALDGFYVYGSLKTRGEVAATYGIFKDAFGYHWIWAVATAVREARSVSDFLPAPVMLASANGKRDAPDLIVD